MAAVAAGSDGVVAADGIGAARLDPAVVARLVDELGPAHVAEVSALFLADARDLLDAARAAQESGDTDAAARIAHRLKSASGFLGAAGISSLCREIERLARDGRLADLGPRIDVLAGEIEHVAAELADLVA